MPLTVEIRRRTPRLRRRRWWPIYAVVLLAAAGLSAPFWVPNFFRQNVIDLVAYRIDRPTEIGRMTVQFSPKPGVVFHDVRIGQPQFNARADRVTIAINVGPLRQRVVDIDSIEVEGLVWTIPERPGDLASEIGALKILPGKGKSSWKSTIARAYAEGARVVVVDHDDPVLVGDVDVRDLLEDKITLAVDAAAPVAGEAAALAGSVAFTKQPDSDPSLAIEGNATLADVDSRAFVDEDVVPNTQLDFASIQFVRTGADSVSIEMNGESYPASAEAAQVESLTGAFKATALWKDGATDVRIDEWRAGGFEFTGDIGVDQDGAVTADIDHGLANASGIDAYFKLRPLAEYTVKPAGDAKLTVEDFEIYRSADGALALQKGTASFAGIDLLVEDGAQAFTGFSGGVSIADNVITLANLSGDGLTLNGTVTPNFEADTYRFNLSGAADLSRDRLSGFVSTDRLTESTGRIQITRLDGTTKPEGGLPDDLAIEGNLSNGRFKIESPDWSDTFENAALTFAAEGGQIKTVGSTASAMFGAVSADGTYFTDEQRWAGSVSGDFSSVELPSVDGKTGEVAHSIFAEFGTSELDVAVAIWGEAQIGTDSPRRATADHGGRRFSEHRRRLVAQ